MTGSARAFAVVLVAALLAVPGATLSAQVVVGSGGEKVVVDGDSVRIQEGGDTVVVDGDWRRAGTATVTTDTEQVLIDLGAVTVDDRIELNLAGDILFEFGSAAIQEAAAAQLAKVAHLIRQRSVGEVFVIGHTDSVGSDDYNRKLSRERAVAVMSWLNRHEGIPVSIMVGSGQGSSRPITHNTRPDGSDDPAGRARNRRVEIQMATRAGVTVGPAVVSSGSGQVVSTGTGKVIASEGDETVEIDLGGLAGLAGDVTVSESGVATSARTVSDERVSSCSAGQMCNLTCPEGDCEMACHAGANCTFACPGGDCRMSCDSGGNCRFSCAGGDCRFTCALGSSCSTSCSGDGCSCSGPGC